MSQRNVEKALRATDRGEAYHWPTVAAILADEVRRLRAADPPRPPSVPETQEPA
jgi:hypothetical protein